MIDAIAPVSSAPASSSDGKATRIRLLDFRSPQMRAFHVTWLAFFLCFFAWFGTAPLMKVIRGELGLSDAQVKNTIIASVAITIVARLVVGWLCDRYGPRLTYTWLLLIGALPVMGIGFATSYESFLVLRLCIGVIGASFVITQFHTSLMFAPNVVGTANATTAGWGNLGGGVTQMAMPLVFGAFIALGFGEFWSWRLSMIIAGLVCWLIAGAYYFLTQDTPEGNFKELRAAGRLPASKALNGFFEVCRDSRVWALFFIYGACFGIELTINNVAALYFADNFGLGLATAGIVAASFGLMNVFARTLGGAFGDRFGNRYGLKGRVRWLFAAVCVEGVLLMLFSRMTTLPLAIVSLVLFSLFVQMSEGATYSVVPFVSKNALGAVSGIVGAGGNFGAVSAGFLLKGFDGWTTGLFVLGGIVSAVSFLAFMVRFSEADDPALAKGASELRSSPVQEFVSEGA
jgi:NNP family nitrate/nitrite transporter-like MFS transporter